VSSRIWLSAAVAWIGVIFFSSTTLASQWCETGFTRLSALLVSLHPSHSSYDLIHLLTDKSVHVALFLVLAALLWKALPSAPAKWAIILLAGLFVGSCSEFLQRFFPGRDPAIRDVLINLSGTALGVVLCLKLARRPADLSSSKEDAVTAVAEK
jgi:VanZ family protein